MNATDNNGEPIQSSLSVFGQHRIILVVIIFAGAIQIPAVLMKPYLSRWMHPNVAAEEKSYLKEKNVRPLPEDLKAILTDSNRTSIPTQNHSLLGNLAPGFTLSDDHGQRIALGNNLQNGCVVVVFYYGYHCNHCVGQLFAIHDDLCKFQELNATVFAVRADPIEDTKTRLEKYGRFGFTVLSDPGNQVAASYGVFTPAKDKLPEELVHGTFLIAADGWVN
jgi:peroxiredoxin